MKLRHVIHHLRHTLECSKCHTLTTAAPVREAVCGFGQHLQGAVAYFSGVGRLAKRTTQRLLADLCETMRDGSLCALGGFTPYPVMSAVTHFPDDFAHAREAAE